MRLFLTGGFALTCKKSKCTTRYTFKLHFDLLFILFHHHIFVIVNNSRNPK